VRAFGSGSSWFVASLAESKLTELYLAFAQMSVNGQFVVSEQPNHD
jgi:hypothetical protein